jgi:hypothetical protein
VVAFNFQRALQAVGITIAWIAALIFIAFARQYHSLAMDFGVYWRVANDPISQAYEHRATLNFPYPPTMLLWISPLDLIPKWPGYLLWVAISVSAFIAACRQHLDLPPLLLALIAPPVTYCLLTGQVSVILGALVLWSCTTDNRIAAGIALGIAATIKPHLVLMAPLLLAATRDFKALVACGMAFTAIVILSITVFGVAAWVAWLGIIEHFQAAVVKNGVLGVTITPASVARLWHLPTVPFLLLGAGVGVWLVLICRNGPPLIRSAAVVAGSLFAAPYAVMYDLAALAPFLGWAIARGKIVAVLGYVGGLNLVPLCAIAFELFTARKEKFADDKPT